MKLAGLEQSHKKSVFASRLCGLIIDEAHLVYVWRQFRSNYASLSRMRTLWPKVPIMTLSATFAPHVATYVHKSLELMKGAKLIRRQIDRPNIYLARREISNQSTFDDLKFIIPNYACDIRLIPKTMIFVDSRPMVCALTDYLLKILSLAWVRSGLGMEPPPQDVVADYTTILSDERRTQVLAKFGEGSCRVIVCTDAAGMGIDIRDVRRVIQWKATSILNLASYFQRVGRAGRDPSCDSVAIMFHQASLGQLENEYAIYREDIQGARGKEILKNIRAFDRGTDDGVLVRRGKRTLKNLLQNRGLEFSEAHSGGANREEVSSDPRKLICRGLLSQIGTRGCMRSSILRYFDFHQSDVAPERCCDSCVQRGALELPNSLASLLPEHVMENYPDDQDEFEDEEDEEDEEEEDENIDHISPPTKTNPATNRARIPGLSTAQIDAFQNALRILRSKIWSSQFKKAIHKLTPFRDTIFLTDHEVSRLSVNGHKIHQVDDIAKHLNANKNFQWTLIAPYIVEVLRCIQDTYAQNAPPPAIRVKKVMPVKKVTPVTDLSAEQILQEQNRKRKLKREANQRYYAKQKALKLGAATNILDELTISHPACGQALPACGAPMTAPMTAQTTAQTTACGQAIPACGTTTSASGQAIPARILRELRFAPNTTPNTGKRNKRVPSTDLENSPKRARIL